MVDEGSRPMPDQPDGVSPPSPKPPGRVASRPPALVTSVVFGAIGAFLLLVGLVGGSEPLVLGAVAAGTLSLISVLVWREQLIVAWRGDRAQRR